MNKKIIKISLTLIENNKSKLELNKLNDWLYGQKDKNWIFDKKLSVTFLAISAIYHYCPEKITGQDLAKILKILTTHESKLGGPYFNENKEIELTTNLAIAYFLSLNKVRLPNLENFIKNNKPKNSLDNYLLRKIQTKKNIPPIKDKEAEMVIENLIKAAKNRFKNLPDYFKKIAETEIIKTIKNNTDRQMSLITHYFKQALGQKGEIINDDFVIKAGLANIFYWTAFIIYDNFWDEDEKALPKILPAANLYARHYIDFYNSVFPQNPEFKIFFQELMDKLDAANNWETLYCRTKVFNNKFLIPQKLPNYRNYELKFYPTAGQILGPVAIMIKLGFRLKSTEVNYLIKYFRYYLIAMQINDDAHDLIEDMERGHLSTVVIMFLKDWQTEYPDKKEIDLINDLEKIQKIFWFKTLKRSSEVTISYTKKSRVALKKLNFLENPKPLEFYIDITERVAKTALTEQQKSLNFLKEF